ncbi:unnamed protein product [Prorocentrum cordatum]|uniref:Uncharacterized protein n=1 Tax=Prorocentrum cordatum TaxID=2364126 RepID=A0ABN9U7Y2_9DINO|nr:unnamed protein product [Polarella glacialis]
MVAARAGGRAEGGGCGGPPAERRWRPAARRAAEAAALGPTAARRAARARACSACEVALRAAVGAGSAPGSWRDRELASRTASWCRAVGCRVPGAARRRRNAQHAVRVPAGGVATASPWKLAWAAGGPRLDMQDAPCVQGVEGEQGQRALAPLSADWEATLEPGITSCSEALESGGKVIHVAELGPRLLSMADEASDEGSEGVDGRVRREHLPRETERDGPPEPRGVGGGEGEGTELILVASMGVVGVDSEAELIEASLGVVDVGSEVASELEVVAGGSDWLAPGV